MFLSRLVLEALDQPDEWRVAMPLVWQDEHYGTYVVPPGTLTDLASIPQAIRNLPMLDVNGASRRPAVLHDFLYHTGGGSHFDKNVADNLLRLALIAEGVPHNVAWIYYYAVRWFGGPAWRAGHAGSKYLDV
jgi:hypothetical protein